MSKVVYTAEAHVTGGRAEGHGRSSDASTGQRLCTELASRFSCRHSSSWCCSSRCDTADGWVAMEPPFHVDA